MMLEGHSGGNVMDSRGLKVMQAQAASLPFYGSVSSPLFSDSIYLPAERQVGFWKNDRGSSGHLDGYSSSVSHVLSPSFGFGVEDPAMDPSNRGGHVVSKGPSEQLKHDEWNRDWSRGPHQGKVSVDQWAAVGSERRASLSSYPWNSSGDIAGLRSSGVLSSSPHVNGTSEKLDGYTDVDTSGFSSSFPALFQNKLRISNAGVNISHSIDTAGSHLNGDLEGEDAFGSLEELESHTIGNLLPDDEEELLAGVTDDFDFGTSNAEDTDDFDLFSSGGGLELEGDPQDHLSAYMNTHRTLDVLVGTTAGQHGGSNAAGSVAGEHPYGEHPSRTLFVRNINSNVEDTELRALFEQYGAIRTLYTACKHRGFVMISYYDIRAARSAMRALQNKPLRRRKLDIHFSIPKDNPSDKDVNQGTLVVFNLDASVSNDDLRTIFGVYGEVKEIRETPHKRHHKFIEFYDVRAAEAALRALNRSDIAGKRIKLEPSRPGGARRSLMQQLSQELEQEESRPHRQQAHSPLTNSPPGHPSQWGSVGNSVDNTLRSLHHSLPHGNFTPLVNKPVNGVAASLPPHLSSPVRVGTIGSHIGQSSQIDAGHSLGHMSLGVHRLPPHHPHSLPENTNSIMNSVNFSPAPGSGSAANNATALRSREAVEASRLQRSSSGTINDPSTFDHANGGHQFLWGTSAPYHHHTQSSPPLIWPSSSVGLSFSHGGQSQPQSHAFSGTHGHLVNQTVLPHRGHHVGSAPPGEPSVLDRRHAYLGESPESSSLIRPGSLTLAGMGIGGSSGTHAINIVGGGHGLLNLAAGIGNNGGLEHTAASPSIGVLSPQHRPRMFPSGSLAGSDSRTTLMIKNIPNKYTSKMLLAAIDEHHRGTYDFIYLPIDFKNKCNVGYAFINMIAPSRIVPFYQAFNGKKWEKFNSEKVASLAYARIQGKAALVAHFQNSSLMNEDKRCRPILFHSEGPHVGDQVFTLIGEEPFPVGVNVRTRPSRDRGSNGGSHQGSPSTSSSSRDESVHGGVGSLSGAVRNSSPDRERE
ncbi:hypothetical protein R1flu_010033 [Riccia fluitans]|uniref:RRM domain-containing protein n=1 Tax=Riccia fluitans TaxID=41844 RepID=A0ABD1Z3U5_9MARC